MHCDEVTAQAKTVGILPSCNQHATVTCYAWPPPNAILTPRLYLALDQVFVPKQYRELRGRGSPAFSQQLRHPHTTPSATLLAAFCVSVAAGAVIKPDQRYKL